MKLWAVLPPPDGGKEVKLFTSELGWNEALSDQEAKIAEELKKRDI
jgi:hypothetical protein